MAKIIISEKQLNLIKNMIMEEIDPSEAYRDESAVNTIINGKRNVGFLATYYKEAHELLKKAKKAGLKVISIPQDLNANSMANIIYRSGYEEQASKLASIARKNGGYLPIETPEETYNIGILLDYNKEAVKQFVLDKFPTYKFY